MRLYRVVLPVGDIEAAAAFYGLLLGRPGRRVFPGRHHFDCDGVLLVVWDPIADGDPAAAGPNPGDVYLSSGEPLGEVRERALRGGATPAAKRGEIGTWPWGERSFYAHDPWGNRFCIVQAGTEYRG